MRGRRSTDVGQYIDRTHRIGGATLNRAEDSIVPLVCECDPTRRARPPAQVHQDIRPSLSHRDANECHSSGGEVLEVCMYVESTVDETNLAKDLRRKRRRGGEGGGR